MTRIPEWRSNSNDKTKICLNFKKRENSRTYLLSLF